MKFRRWLVSKTHKQPRFNDFKEDVLDDSATKKLPNTLPAWARYLISMDADKNAFLALGAAWRAYTAEGV